MSGPRWFSFDLRARTEEWVSFFRQFAHLSGPYWISEKKWQARTLTAALFVLTLGQVAIPVVMNLWSEKLFDALEQRALREFLTLVAIFGGIIAANVLITVLHLRVRRDLQVAWRTWLTERIMGEWMVAGRHYQVNYMPGEHDNPDGRIAEDIRITTEYAIDLAHSLVYCLLLLISFTQILWNLSGAPEIEIGDFTFYLPGHLVWLAILYTGIGTSIAWWLGQPLVGAANRRQMHEASFRFGLAHAREHSLQIALLRGETDERRSLRDLFRNAVEAWHRQTFALMNLNYFTASWSILTQVFPVLVAAPRYITGTITLGVLMQTAQGFQQMVGALSWPIDNLAKVAEWRASVERVLGLHEALRGTSERVSSPGAPMIVAEVGNRPVLAFEDVTINEPDGRMVIDSFSAEIHPGDRILIAGDPGVAFKILKVVAGLWPWGKGHLRLPSDGPVFFLPQHPYLPMRPLRDTITYPLAPDTVGDDTIGEALTRVGLEYLIPSLPDVERWQEILPIGEQQRLGFARLLLFRPRWIFIQEALDALDPEDRHAMLRLLDVEFPQAAVITIGHHPDLEVHHNRRMALVDRDVVQDCPVNTG